MRLRTMSIALGLLLAQGPSPSWAADPAIEFASSDPRLVRAFEWAKRQALAYAFDDGDPVGPWYEAALPGREAFCMRDLTHAPTPTCRSCAATWAPPAPFSGRRPTCAR